MLIQNRKRMEILVSPVPRHHVFKPRTFSLSLEAVVQRYSVKKVFLEISQYSQENTWPESLFLINFIKKEAQAQGFPVNFVKFLRTPFFIEHFWRLLLYPVVPWVNIPTKLPRFKHF